MITKEELYKQLFGKPFRGLLFTVFNLIEDDGFVIEANNHDKTQYDMEDFDFIKFDISDDDKKAIKCKKSDILSILNDFKYEVEKQKQKAFPYCRIYVMKDLGSVIAVKLKPFDVAKLK